MKKHALIPLIPAVACVAFAAPALASTPVTTQPESVSENWAGYEVTSKTSDDFSSVSGAWTEPKVSCSSEDSGYAGYFSGGGSGSYSAFWVGLGGGDENSDALEQIGTQADCSASGTKRYYAWYELVPSAPVKIDLSVHPGDKMWARTSVSGDEVSFTIDDATTGASWSRTIKMTAATPDTKTAELIAEAPSACEGGATGDCSPLTLANFGKVRFTDVSISSGDSTGSLASSDWSAEPISLDGEASPGSLSSDGSAFTVKYGSSGGESVSYSQDPYGDGGTGADGGYGYGYPQGYSGSAAGQSSGGYSGEGDGGQGSWWSDGYPGAYSYSYGDGYGYSYSYGYGYGY